MRPTCRPNATRGSPNCRRCSTPTAERATPDRCCWCCRAWTPRARAASSNTSSARAVRWASATPASACPPKRSASTTTCGGSAMRCRPAGHIGVFDRSHYEDVLVVRVHNLVPPEVWGARYDEINAFEKELVDAGTTIVKVAMFVSLDEQKERLAERLDRPGQVLEVQPGRSRRARAVAGLPGGLSGGAGQDVDGLRAVARGAVRQEVVQPAGRHRAAHRGAEESRTCPGRQPISMSRRRRSGCA